MTSPTDLDSLTPEQKRALLEKLLREKAARAGPTPPTLKPVAREGELLLSASQERIFFLDAMDPGGADYNVAGCFHLRGNLRVAALEGALTRIVSRHEPLRTRFVRRDGKVLQDILQPSPVVLPKVDLTGLPEAERTVRLRALQAEQVGRGFVLSEAPPLRFTLAQLDARTHALVLVMHNIITDGVSLKVLFDELASHYRALRNGSESLLPPLAIQFADFAAWERERLASPELAKQLEYWRQRLETEAPSLQLALERPDRAEQTFARESFELELSSRISSQLAAWSRARGVTPFMVLCAAYLGLLHRRTGLNDLVIGTPVAGRGRPELERIIGCFQNTIVLRVEVDGGLGFDELLQRVRTASLEAFSRQDVPFDRIVEAVRPERSADRMPLMQVMYGHQVDSRAGLKLDELEVTAEPLDTGTTRFEMSLLTLEDPDSGIFRALLSYRTDLFAEDEVRQFARQYEALLLGALEEPGRPLSRLPLLSSEQRAHVLHAFNATDSGPAGDSLPRRISRAAARTPEAVALVSGDEQLSFRDLEQRANRLAHWLIARGVGPDVQVALCGDRASETVVAMLAVLKAGGAYVPLDPAYPQERLAFMLSNSDCRVLFVQGRGEAFATLAPGRAFPIAAAENEALALSAEAPVERSEPANLAYVIYTSGSTGRPKGVMVSHAGLSHYLSWADASYPSNGERGAPVHSSLSFDLTVTSLWLPLSRGRAVQLLPEAAGVEALAEAMRDTRFDLVKITPAHLELLRQQIEAGARVTPPCCFVVGGEELPRRVVEAWWALAPQTVIVNEYGPTETVVGCSVEGLVAGGRIRGPVSIGRPIARTRLYVLDDALEPVPVGVPGELYIGGAGVARGYHLRPELTAERFLPDPFGPPGARLYRTGDRARYRPDGRLDFLGRVDSQVKVRGYRIELGEVETAIARHPSVLEAVVIVREDGGDKRLVGYVVPRPGSVMEPALESFLAEWLPPWMIPHHVVQLDKLPLTTHGKVDRAALPSPEQAAPIAAGRFWTPPQGPEEEAIARIWSELLGVSRIGRDDDFFALGGHSLLAMQLVFRVRESLGVTLPLRAVFDVPVLSQLAATLRSLPTSP